MTLPANWPQFDALTLGALIEEGTLDPVSLTEAAIERVSRFDPMERIFLHGSEERALTEAIAAHDRARRGLRRSPLDGVPIAWKDNVEAIGAPTTNGCKLLAHHMAKHDAVVLERGVRAGLVTLGKTALVEFAFSGLGYNPTMGSPNNPFDRETPRCPGGSSCGTAVAVATGLAPLGVGTDTAGSVRIPAAWNGLVGLKTTAGSIPLDGIQPLSPTLDTVGPLTRTVADAAVLWAILAARPAPDLSGADLSRTLFAIPKSVELETDPDVWAVFCAATEALRGANSIIATETLPQIDKTHDLIDMRGTPVAAEAWAIWGELIESDPNKVYDNVRIRIEKDAKATSGTEFAELTQTLSRLSRDYLAATAHLDAVILPTVADVPPPLADLASREGYAAANQGALRFTRLANMLGLCALTVPCGMTRPAKGQPPLPVGLMLMGPPNAETRLLRLGAAIEKILPKAPLPIS